MQIIETFVHLRKLAANYDKLMNQIRALESKNNNEFGKIYEILKSLLSKPNQSPRPKIGYIKK
jgi:hypothetical protein